MKLSLNKILSFFVVSLLATSCLKKGDANTDIEDRTQNILSLQFLEGGTTVNSGLQYFSGGALTYPSTETSHVAEFNVAINGAFDVGKDLPVTLEVDPSKAQDNFANDGVNYVLMPDSLYSLTSMSVVIPVGSRIVTQQITFYPSKVDPTKSYILPLTIKDGGGQAISSNLSTIYFHVIGNPLAGIYDVAGTRYNYTGIIAYAGGPIPTPVGTVTSPVKKTAAPKSPTVVTLDFANLGPTYYYSITYDESKPDEIEVELVPPANSISNVAIISATYDHLLRKIHILSTYNNALAGAGNDRIIDETFTHQ